MSRSALPAHRPPPALTPTRLGRPASVLLCLALAGAACGEAAPESARTAVRDSAGLTVVESRTADVPRVQVTGHPLVAAGSLDDADALFDVTAVGRLADGGWALANAGTREVLIYGPGGERLRSQGGQGEGPGEFTSLSSLVVLPGDSLLAFDRRQGRATVFSPTGQVARIQSLADDEAVRAGTVVGRLDGGWLLVDGASRFGGDLPDAGLVRPPETYALVSPGGDEIRTLGTFPGSEEYLEVGDGFISIRSVPFTKSAAVAGSGDVIVAGVTERAELTVWNSRGDTVALWRLDHEPPPVTDADWDQAVEARLDRLDDDSAAARARRFWADAPRPERHPAWSALHLGADGRVWLRRFDPPGGEATNRWWRLEADGALRDVVALPERFVLRWSRGDTVAGIRRDELDVEYFEVYETGAGPGV